MPPWKSCLLGDVVNLKRGYDLPQTARLNGPFPVVSSSGITDRHAEAKVKGPGVITGRYGTLGEVFYVEEDFWPLNTSLYVQDFKGNDPRFIAYLLGTLNLGSQNAAGAVPGVNRNHLHSLLVCVPPLPVQQRLAAILSNYDDLIENCQRRIKILESMARALYREWFVKPCFREGGVLLHGKELPGGWTLANLDAVAEVRLGKMLDQNKNRGELRPYLANVNVRWGEFELGALREMRFEGHELDTYGLRTGDIVMCEGGEPGRCAIWREQIPGMMFQKALHRIRPRTGMSFVYLYHTLRHLGESGALAALFTGSTIKHLPLEKLSKVRLGIPPSDELLRFDRVAGDMESQVFILQRQILNLRRTRDLLLPRLMSGQIDLTEDAAA